MMMKKSNCGGSVWMIRIWYFSLWIVITLLHPPTTSNYLLFVRGEDVVEVAEEEDPYYFYYNDREVSKYITELTIYDENPTDEPDFIYHPNKNQGHGNRNRNGGDVRIVEYYAHWCPHCQHLREHYISFAKEINNVAEPSGIHVSMYAVSCVPHKNVCRDQGVTGYPRVKLYPAGSTNGTFIEPWQLHPLHVLRLIGVEDDIGAEPIEVLEERELLQQQQQPPEQPKGGIGQKISRRIGQKQQQQQPNDEAETTPTEKPFFIPRTKQDVFNDAYLSFEFAMRNGVYAGVADSLSNSTKDALDEWIHLLQSTLPPTWKLQELITDLIKNFDDIVQGEEKLMTIVDKHPPPVTTFSVSCTRGDKYAGYTCGLWELFHIMSIGLVEWNNLAMGDDWAYYVPEDVGHILRNYIEKFFGCEECRMNFLHEYDACEFDRCNRMVEEEIGEFEDWKELPLWLFETHNAVNARLLRERTEREEKRTPTNQESINVLWPSQRDCPTCWHADGRWDQDQVYMYLRLTYWPEDKKSSDMRRKVLEKQRQIDEAAEGEEFDHLPPWVAPMIPVVFLLLTVLSWYRRRVFVQQSGRHKKTDE